MRYLLEKKANPNTQGFFHYATALTPYVTRLILAHGAAYEQRFEYKCRETKQQISKIVRYNDRERELNEKLILSLICYPPMQPQIVPPPQREGAVMTAAEQQAQQTAQTQ